MPVETRNGRSEHPYSAARLVGPFAFASGALSVGQDGAAVGGRREALDAAMTVLAERLSVVGAELIDVVKLTYYVTDLSLRTEANRQFEDVFQEPRPARTFVEVAGLPYGATVELDAIAYVERRRE